MTKIFRKHFDGFPRRRAPLLWSRIPFLWTVLTGVCKHLAQLLLLAVHRRCCSVRTAVLALRTLFVIGLMLTSANLPLQRAGWRADGGNCIAARIRSSRNSRDIWPLLLLCLSPPWRSVCLADKGTPDAVSSPFIFTYMLGYDVTGTFQCIFTFFTSPFT